MKERFKGLVLDPLMVSGMLALVFVGLVCLFSATAGSHEAILKTGFGKQVIWFFFGGLVFIAVLLTPFKVFFRGCYLLYGISFVLLLVVLLLNSWKVHRWVELGPLQFQPSELAKVATLFVLARYLSEEKGKVLGWKRVLGALGFVLIPMILIVREPDVGTASVFLALLVVMLIWSGIGLKMAVSILVPIIALVSGFYLFSFIGFMLALTVGLVITKQKWWKKLGMAVICVFLGLSAPKIWTQLEPYQQQRILIFLGVKSDPRGAAYQVIQSKVAIGSGGILGKGFLRGSQTQLRFLPEQHTDFIFSVLGEECGFIGVMVVLGLFLFLFSRMFRAAKVARNRFASFVAVGCVSILGFQFFVNVGMTVGLVPVIGLPIPFLSYGGSSLSMSMTLAGLTANVFGHRYEY